MSINDVCPFQEEVLKDWVRILYILPFMETRKVTCLRYGATQSGSLRCCWEKKPLWRVAGLMVDFASVRKNLVLSRWAFRTHLHLCCACHSVVSNSLWPQAPLSTGVFQAKYTGVGCHALLQGIFPTQESNPGLPHCRQILYCLSTVHPIKANKIRNT